jgi:hypothetical protein
LSNHLFKDWNKLFPDITKNTTTESYKGALTHDVLFDTYPHFCRKNENQTKIVKSKIKRKIVKTHCNLLCSEIFYLFGNILPGMRRKVNISTLTVFRNQSNSNNTVPSIAGRGLERS